MPLLVDADGLNCLSQDVGTLSEATGPRLVTPHPGEMGRLVGLSAREVQQDREGAATQFAQRYNCVVALKGYRTIITDGRDVFVNPTGNPGMASGGTGDVLAGLIGGLMAQGLSGTNAAVVAVYLHGLAGDLAVETTTKRGMIARDLIDCIPRAWWLLEEGE